MIKFVEKENTLNIYYGDELVFNHSVSNPVFYLGRGQETVHSYRGNYDIKDNIIDRIGLESYQIKDNVVIFYHLDIKLELEFKEINNRLEGFLNCNEEFNRFWMRLSALEEENVYGCGEQASYFNLRHRNFPLWTSEPGVGRDKNSLTTYYADLYDKCGGDYYTTYYSEQTFVSSRKYWIHTDSYAYAEFNFENPLFHELHIWEIPKRFILSFEDSYLNLVEDLTEFTGRTAILPEFVLNGIILGVQGGYKIVKEYLNQALDHGIKVGGLWTQDWAGINYTTFGKRLYWNWKVNEELYPNLKSEITKLDKDNIALLTYVCPFLLEEESLFLEAKENGFLAMNKKHEVYKEDFGEFYCGIVDLTNPAAFDWYKNKIKVNLIDLGIKGWMADFGEYLPLDCVLYNKRDPKLMHNEWPVLWARCNYEAVKESNKLGEVFYFMRSGGHGSQKYATALWAGDQSVNWELHDGIASVIPSALSVGIIGNPFTHSDIGGYTSLYGNIRSKELFDRWLEMNVFTTIMRTHEGNRPTQNFQYYNDEDTLKLMGRMTNLRYDLKPYISFLIEEGSSKGYPVQRPLFMHYEDDLNTYNIQYQYLFGKDILVKPVVCEGQIEQTVYLPKDNWVHLFTGKKYDGQSEITVDCPIGYPPIFFREDSEFSDLFKQITLKYKI